VCRLRQASALLWLALSLGVVEAGAVGAQQVAVRPEPLRADQLRLERSSAADLQVRPSLWNWTEPLAIPRLSQGQAAKSEPVAQSEPVANAEAEDDNDILDEVSVTATRRAVRQRDTTATTYSVKKEDFKAQGAAAVGDALRLVPGFQGSPSLGGVRNIGNTFLRGFNDQRFTVLKDALPTTRSSNGRSDFAGFQAEDLERIEVVTGGATLRYGSGSVGGVINLITETPKGPPKLTLNYEVGSYGYSKYVTKYGGGDDVFSYNFVYTGIVSFNNYPYSYTLPNTAQFYGPTSNPNATIPSAIPSTNQYPTSPTGVRNSFGLGNNDPANNGRIDLFGFIKPEVGPPVLVSGVQSAAANASDVYSAKLVWKPDQANRLTFRFGQQNRSYFTTSPGNFSTSACIGRTSTLSDAGAVLAGQRVAPVVPDNSAPSGVRVLPCDTQRFLINSPSVLQATGFGVWPISADLSGRPINTYGQPFLSGIEDNFGLNPPQVQRQDIGQFDVALLWDYDLSPTTSINSYLYYLRLYNTQFNQQLYAFNSNLERAFGEGRLPGPPGLRIPQTPAQAFIDNNKYEFQTALNTKLSAGQDLSFGFNLLDDRSYQQQVQQAGINPTNPFFDRAISRWSVFLIDDISFSNELKGNVGLRYTRSSQFGDVLTPAVGARYNFSNAFSVRANWSQVFNAPNITAIFLSGGANLINTGLKPETGVTYDVGFDFTPANNVGIRFTYFYTYLDGVFGAFTFQNPDPALRTQFPLVNQNVNLDSRLATGIEFTTDWQISDQFRFRVAWTNIDARAYGNVDNITQNTFPYFYEYQDPQLPFNNVTFNLAYNNRGMLFSLLGSYDSGKRRNNSLNFVPAWFTLDLNAEIPLTPGLALTGNIFNIFDTRYEFLDGRPAPGTTFRVGARYEIGG
jgi:iron complex outermembrane receptor protein